LLYIIAYQQSTKHHVKRPYGCNPRSILKVILSVKIRSNKNGTYPMTPSSSLLRLRPGPDATWNWRFGKGRPCACIPASNGQFIAQHDLKAPMIVVSLHLDISATPTFFRCENDNKFSRASFTFLAVDESSALWLRTLRLTSTLESTN